MNKILIFLARLIGFHFIPENYRAVVTRLGMYNRVRGPGFVWVVPLVERVENLVRLGMRLTVFTVEQVVSSDGIPFDFKLTVRYSFDPDSLSRPIAEQMVRQPDHILEDIVKDYADTSLRRTVAQYSAEDIFKRGVVADIEKGVTEDLRAQVKNLGLAPMADSGMVIKGITPPQDFLDAILAAKRYEIILRVLTAYQAADVDQALLAEWVRSFKDASPEDFYSLLETILIDDGKMVVKRRWQQGEDPYVVGPPIESPEAFYGRQEILADLLQALRAGNHVAIYGERRIGKTSLLHQLAHHLRQIRDADYRYVPAFVSLQMAPSEEQFFSALMRGIADASRDDTDPLGLRCDEQRTDYDSLDMARDLTVVLEKLQAQQDRLVRLVLLMDEADRMNSFDQHTQGALRGLLMHFSRRVLLVWSGQTLNRDWYLDTSPWYNLFKHEVHLNAFSETEEAEARRLIQEPVRGLLYYDGEAVAQILAYSGRKPYAIQRLCSKVIKQALDAGRTHITVEDVHRAHRLLTEEDATQAATEREPAVYPTRLPTGQLAEERATYDTETDEGDR